MTDIDKLLAQNKQPEKQSGFLRKAKKLILAGGVVTMGLGFVFGPRLIEAFQQAEAEFKKSELENNRAQAAEDGMTITYNANNGKSDTSYTLGVGEYINGTHKATNKGPQRDTIKIGDNTILIHDEISNSDWHFSRSEFVKNLDSEAPFRSEHGEEYADTLRLGQAPFIEERMKEIDRLAKTDRTDADDAKMARLQKEIVQNISDAVKIGQKKNVHWNDFKSLDKEKHSNAVSAFLKQDKNTMQGI